MWTIEIELHHQFMGNRWGNNGNSVRPKITADGDCSHEIKRHLLLGRKVMTNLDSIFKSRDITLPSPKLAVWTAKNYFFDIIYFTSRRRQWHPTPVLLPGKSHGRRSLVGCSPWGREESETTERLHFHALEKEMATHSSILAWRIPRTGEPGRLPSMGSHRVGHE